MRCEEAQELITGLVDNELSTQESELITAHFGECAECPRFFAHEYAFKRLLKRSAGQIQAPTQLRDKIASTRNRDPIETEWLSRPWRALPRSRSFALQAAALVTLLAIPFFSAQFWLKSAYRPIAPGMFQNYRQITAGEIVPIEMHGPSDLKTRLTRLVDRQFTPMAYDFSTMNIHLVGGMLQTIANRNVLVAVYRAHDLIIVCFTFVASEGDAPDVATIFFDAAKGINFYQFSHAEANAVMHREGNINCVLMSRLPMTDLLKLARAKAHPS